MVVDDEPDIREVLELSIQFQGFDTCSADSGESALEILEQTPIDAVVSDVRMPHGDGVFLLKNMRKRHPGIPVVIITGFADHSREELIDIGATDVLFKPFSTSELRQKLAGLKSAHAIRGSSGEDAS